jgi:hypothetical protein
MSVLHVKLLRYCVVPVTKNRANNDFLHGPGFSHTEKGETVIGVSWMLRRGSIQ